jgi:hypothetical protein
MSPLTADHTTNTERRQSLKITARGAPGVFDVLKRFQSFRLGKSQSEMDICVRRLAVTTECSYT